MIRTVVRVAFATTLATAGGAWAQQADMSFFITSAGPGKGGDLGGLAGADAHCAALADAAGAGGKTWRAYLSGEGVDARDRIGKGPWRNARGEVVADDVESLHATGGAISKAVALNERGEPVNGRGDTPNRHDVLTGSDMDGKAVAGMNCNDWTSSDAGQAMVGHHDRIGLRDDAPSKSWNSSHPSRGCGQEALRGTGGDGLFYCFAAE